MIRKLRTEAVIWLARIYNETGNFSESSRLINGIEMTSDFSKPLKPMYYTTLADLFIKQKRYQEAIDPLGKAIELFQVKEQDTGLHIFLPSYMKRLVMGRRQWLFTGTLLI